MANVFIVTHGDYSNYSIDAVFSTEELAEEWIAKKNAADEYPERHDIETWGLNAEMPRSWLSRLDRSGCAANERLLPLR
jgi:hypothetical protein